MARDGYEAAVERAKEYIRAGDVYQVVPSQRWSGRLPGARRSRSTAACASSTRRPYMYFLEFEDFAIAGASPEPLVKVTGRRAEQRPIAGTRPRAAERPRRTCARARSCWRTRRSARST